MKLSQRTKSYETGSIVTICLSGLCNYDWLNGIESKNEIVQNWVNSYCLLVWVASFWLAEYNPVKNWNHIKPGPWDEGEDLPRFGLSRSGLTVPRGVNGLDISLHVYNGTW